MCRSGFFCVALDRQVVANTVNININILKCRLSIVSPRYWHKCLDGPYNVHRSGTNSTTTASTTKTTITILLYYKQLLLLYY